MRTTNKMVMGLVAALSLFGCVEGPEGSNEEAPDVNWDQVTEEATIPQAAQEIMAAVAGTSNVVPTYYACPAFVAYKTRAMTESGLGDPNWNIITDWFYPVDQVTWHPYGSNNYVRIYCEVSSFLHLMNVSRLVPGTQCSTSADTPQNDGHWFVCF